MNEGILVKVVASLVWLVMLSALLVGLFVLGGCTPAREIIHIDLTTGQETREVIGSELDLDAIHSLVDMYFAIRLLELELRQLRAAEERQPENVDIQTRIEEVLGLIERIEGKAVQRE